MDGACVACGVALKPANRLVEAAGVAVLPNLKAGVAGAGVAGAAAGAGVASALACVLTDEESAPPDGAPNVKGVEVLVPNREEVPPVVAVFDPNGVAGAWEVPLVILPNKGLGVSEADAAWTDADIPPNRAFGVDALSCAAGAAVLAPNWNGVLLVVELLFKFPNKLLAGVEEGAALLF